MRKRTIKDILSHAELEYPKESCGVVVMSGRKERYIPCRNINPEPTQHFTLSPEDYAVAEDEGEVIRICHSHPDATTQPSELDRAQCDTTEVPWIIVSWPEGDLREIQPRGELPLVGREFVLGHTDCGGLILSYYQQVHGIDIPDHRTEQLWWESGEENIYMDNWYQAGFREFAGEPIEGDMVIMQISAPVPNHAGVLIDGGMLLHHLYGQLSQRVPYGGYWKDRTVKIVRHKDLIVY
ncbi:C40 family peptidase [Pragia fontium]|uniref:C40 family peptidase n=1 Tax=Pragia fontium TaxID=82985 RepID=UPI00064A07C5|nr:C40 family peptidase [Pragia fontium]AKJ41481.1 peptidase P60 [Pragia fontium]